MMEICWQVAEEVSLLKARRRNGVLAKENDGSWRSQGDV